ncbi:MAG: proline dehydrogenase family protein [Acidothermus cellulolyticus]|nr:proline dehydrogenase family protein [Acidothermus cellulolyticus]
MLRRLILEAADSQTLRRLIATAPPTRAVVHRFVAGTEVADGLAVARQLVADGLLVSLDRLGEQVRDLSQARATAEAYRELAAAIEQAGLSAEVEISLKLSALGLGLAGNASVGSPEEPRRVALDLAREICAAAQAAGTMVTFDMEDHTTTDDTLAIVAELRREFPSVGCVIQAYLRRSLADCRELAEAGARVRLCKGAYREPAEVAFTRRHEVDRNFVRCLRILMRGSGYPMVATHDPRLIAIASVMATQAGRGKDTYEFQMLYGVRPDEQQRLVRRGERVRVYVPYGGQWYPYLMRRLAERPANVAFFLRALGSKK